MLETPMTELSSSRAQDVSSEWVPETPFLDRVVSNEATGWPAAPARLSTLESPFRAAFRETTDTDESDAMASLVAELLDELHDDEFDDALFELVDEAWDLGGPRIAYESRRAATSGARTERLLWEHFQPLVRRAEDMADSLSHHFSASSDDASPAVLEHAIELFTYDGGGSQGLSPAFENFLGSWGKKLKGFAKGALRVAGKVAKTGVQLAGAPLIRLALSKLRKAVGPMLKKLIGIALDKLPAPLRPLAVRLAGRLGGSHGIKAAQALLGTQGRRDGAKTATASPDSNTNGATSDQSADGAIPPDDAPSGDTGGTASASDAGDDSSEPEDSAVPDVAAVQDELDLQFLETLFDESGDELPSDLDEAESMDTWGELDRAREDFVRESGDLPSGRSPAVAVENFVPAVLMAVRPAIKLIGRQHVVKVIAGMITPLIQPVVGKAVAPQLGKAIADIGLRTLLQAELDADQMHELGARAVASTVEETIRDISSLPDAVVSDEALLESHVRTAYEAAVARNFPPAMIKPALRESAGVNGTWVAMPESGIKYYKKFTRVFDVTLTPQLASAVRTFKGRTLASFLRETLRLEGARRARVHLYEAVPRTRLSRIANLEKVRGLGSSQRWASMQIHPLTTEAATALLQQPGLGRPVSSRIDPRRPVLGQRFYYLEIDGAPARPQGVGTTLGITLDFVRNEIRLRLYLSETAAQDIASAVRANVSSGALAARMRTALTDFARAFRADGGHELVRIILAGTPGRTRGARDLTAAVRQALERRVGAQVLEWGWARLTDHIRSVPAEFSDMTAKPADGVTCLVTFANPAGFQGLRQAFEGGGVVPGLSAWPPKDVPAAQVRLAAGDARG